MESPPTKLKIVVFEGLVLGFYNYIAVRPPSMGYNAPVQNEASDEARK